MRKVFLVGMLLICLLLTSACSVSEMSTLSDLSKPYAGIYKCEQILLGGEDQSEQFENLSLGLSYNGRFELKYSGKSGGRGGYAGTYRVNPEKEEITFSVQDGPRQKSYTFPVRKGRIYIDLPLGGKLLHAKFSMP